MAYPWLVAIGSCVGDSGFYIDVPYPTTTANGLLIAVVGDADNDSFSTPEDWTLGGEFTADSNFSCAWFWRRSEFGMSGTVRFLSALGDGNCVGGVMFQFGSHELDSDPFEAETSVAVTQATSATISDITTLGEQRLCVCLVCVEDNVGTSDDASTYSQEADVSTDVGSDMGFSVFAYEKATAGAAGADSCTIGGNEYHATFTFALIPENITPLGYANDVIGVGAADIGDVTTVATADIAEVIGV